MLGPNSRLGQEIQRILKECPDGLTPDDLEIELRQRGFRVDVQLGLPIEYNGIQLDVGYRIDLLIEDTIIVELKAVSEIQPIHEAQLLSYLKLSKKKVGLLINFHVLRLKDGIKRMAN